MYARCKFSRAASTCPATISTNLINCSAAEERKKDFKPTIGMPDGRRKRDEVKLKIRRDKKDANIRRRRMGDSTKALDEAVGQAITPLGSCQIEQIAQACEVIAQQASTQQELLIAIRNLRKVLGASQAGTSIVEFIVQNGAVPLLINRLKVLPGHSVDLIAQTILTLTNLSALGHNAYLVKEKAVEAVAPFIHHDHPEVRKQTAWCLGNIATENDSYRNWLIRQDIIVKGL